MRWVNCQLGAWSNEGKIRPSETDSRKNQAQEEHNQSTRRAENASLSNTVCNNACKGHAARKLLLMKIARQHAITANSHHTAWLMVA